MSTQRYISTSFWDDEWIQTLDPSEKLLYLYYMTNPLTNIAGIYKVTERRVSFDTGFTQATIQHIMQKFEKAGKTFRHGEWIIIPTWAKHQKVSERDNNRKGIDSILKSLPDVVFNYAVEKGYKYIYLKELGRPLQAPSNTSNYPNLNSDIESESDKDTPDKPAIPSTTSKKKKSKPVKVDKGEYKPYGEHNKVFFYDSEYSKLVEEHSEDVVSAAIDIVDEYLTKNPSKSYTDFVRVFNSWALEEAEKRVKQSFFKNSSTLPRQDSAPAVDVVCCGQPYSHVLGFCKVCGKSYKRDGAER